MAKKYHTVSSSQPLSGGREMITERRIPCTSGCTYCKSDRKPSRPSDLDFNPSNGRNGSPSSSTLKERLPTPYHFEFQPVPRPERERRREKRSSERENYYSDGGYGLRRSSSLRGPSQPIPIPPRRSSTMHEDDRWRESLDRPRVVQRSSSRRESDDIPLGFYDLLYNHGATSSTRQGDRDRYAVKGPRYEEPTRTRSHRRRSESPMEVRHKEDEQYRERPALRRKPKIIQDGVHQDIIYGSSPLVGSFGSSSYGSHRSSTLHGSLPLASQSPPKSVHWGDDRRAAQNAKISNRPRLSRSATISGAGTGSHLPGEVKSILKRSGDDAPSTETAYAGSPPAVKDLSREQYNALYKSAQGIGVEDRATSPQRKVKEERTAAMDQIDSDGMIDSLRKRINTTRATGETRGDRRYSFDMPPRRFSSVYGEKASSRNRRSEMFYDDGRRDWY